MENIEFKLGQLDQFKCDVLSRLACLEVKTNERFDIVERKLDELRQWKFKTVGFVSGAWVILTFVWEIIRKKINF